MKTIKKAIYLTLAATLATILSYQAGRQFESFIFKNENQRLTTKIEDTRILNLNDLEKNELYAGTVENGEVLDSVFSAFQNQIQNFNVVLRKDMDSYDDHAIKFFGNWRPTYGGAPTESTPKIETPKGNLAIFLDPDKSAFESPVDMQEYLSSEGYILANNCNNAAFKLYESENFKLVGGINYPKAGEQATFIENIDGLLQPTKDLSEIDESEAGMYEVIETPAKSNYKTADVYIFQRN